MPVSLITTDQGPLYWYKQSCLLLHNDRFFAVDRSCYLGELMLANVSTKNIKVILTYPQVPFCPLHYLLKIQYRAIEGIILLHPDPPAPSSHIAGRSTAFYPMRHLPGDSGYIPHIIGRSRDFLTPSVNKIQDWMRAAARHRIKKRMLALAMGAHPRLGQNSPLLGLDDDLLRSLFE
jgi:hypothetical protein